MGSSDRGGREGGPSRRDRPRGEGGLREGADEPALEHRTRESFWDNYYSLPEEIQERADAKFELLKKNADYPSLDFKPVDETAHGKLYRARVTKKRYRALALRVEEGIYVWFFIGTHDEYERLIE